MTAVIELAGFQWKVSPGMKLWVPRLPYDLQTEITLDKILLYQEGDTLEVGTPYVSKVLKAKVIDHAQGPKIKVFKKKRRKGYKKTYGFRPKLTQIEIL
ncbi:MAG: 50S ribosomal protein L21 [Bacteroidia bacterium]